MQDVLYFLVDTFFSLVFFVFLLRLLLQWARADFRNPLAQAILRLSNWLIMPLRRLLPPIGRIDTASVVAVDQTTIDYLKGRPFSPSGDVWIVDGSPKLTRYAAETGDSEDRKGWEEKVQPIYIKSCTPCHEPGGSSGADLSTYGAWVARRTQLQDEVITKKTMPPQGIEFSDMDRTVLGDWISAAPK